MAVILVGKRESQGEKKKKGKENYFYKGKEKVGEIQNKRSNVGMNTLQRSSYSYRRDGSSGRIWDYNVVHVPETKPPAPSRELTRTYFISNSTASDHNPTPPPPSRSERKIRRCAFLSIFVHCVRSPATQRPLINQMLHQLILCTYFLFLVYAMCCAFGHIFIQTPRYSL